MLLAGINDSESAVQGVAEYLGNLPLDLAYLATPTRPTCDPEAHAPDEAVLIRAYRQLSAGKMQVETLIGYEGDAFAASGDVVADILSITAVHPLRHSAINALLQRDNAAWSQVQILIDSGELREVEHEGERFYTRRLKR